tara:strand:- start:381 stop:4634 length:4254 start_codon:yes stop_codon:yes gene_type:complete
MKSINIDNVDARFNYIGPDVPDGGDPIEPHPGCTDPEACNYNSYATYDNDSCTYPNDYCAGLSENIYGGDYEDAACDLAPLDTCSGCYITDPEWNVPQHVNNEGGQGNEWCEYCDIEGAINYTPSEQVVSGMKSKPAMCLFAVCLTPENTNLTACNTHALNEDTIAAGFADNYSHDESKCVYAHEGCHCVGENAAVDSNYCGSCMDNQPSAPSAYYQEGLAAGYCSCDGIPNDGYCYCDGEEETLYCGCDTIVLPQHTSQWCDCNGEQPKSSICGCGPNQTTGTVLPSYPTQDITDINGDPISVYSNTSEGGVPACDCDDSEIPIAYYLDINGDGYGWAGNGAIYVCTIHLQGGALNISTPGTPVAGGWTTSESACADDSKDCNGICPSEYISSYAANLAATPNECGECITPPAQTTGWFEECCAGTVGTGECQICPDAYNGEGAYSEAPVMGAMKTSDDNNPDASSMDNQYITYNTNVPSGAGWETDYFFTCNCANIVGGNYYDDNIVNTMYNGDACNSCKQKDSDDFKTIVTDPDILTQIGGTLGTVVQNGIGEYFCNCNVVSNNVVPGTSCCLGKTLACDGNCYYPNADNMPTDVGCGCGNPEADECGCAEGGIPGGNCDCDGNILDCAGDCGGSAVDDECDVCGGNDSTCTGCMDEEAYNYDASARVACDNCCTFLSSTILELIQTDTDADASGAVVSQANLATPFAMLQPTWSEGAADTIASLQVWYEQGVVAPNLNITSSTGQAIYGWQEFVDNDFIIGQANSSIGSNLYQFSSPRISSKVQKISSDNLQIICENPQTNGVVNYNIFDANNVKQLSNIYYYGSEVSNINAYYSTLYTYSGGGYADVSQISYYFYLDETIEFTTLNVQEIFGSFSGIKQIKYKTSTIGAPTYLPVEGNSFDSIGNIQSGILGHLDVNGVHDAPTTGNTSYINKFGQTVSSSAESIPVYHIYEITVNTAAEFIIDLSSFVPDPPVFGCMDQNACYYNSAATDDDGSCTYQTDEFYCDGSVIPVEGCLDVNADNYSPGANVDTDNVCIYSGCTNPLALNYDPKATVNDGTCELPEACDGLPLTPSCCQSGYMNSITDFTLVDNIPIANNECEICDSSICANEDDIVYICCNDEAINTFAGDFIEGVTICSSAVCDFPSPGPEALHIKTIISNPYDVTPTMLEKLQWVIYDTSANIVASSSFISSEAMSSYPVEIEYAGNTETINLQQIHNIDNIITYSGCLWFIPIGYKENSIWDYVQLDIMYGGNSIHQLHGIYTPPRKEPGGPSKYPGEGNYSSSTERGSVKITHFGECELDCDKNTIALQTEFCEFPLRKDVIEFTEVFLIVETAQRDSDFSNSSVIIYNLDNGQILTNITGMENSSTYSKRFVILKDTPIGIKAVGNGSAPLSYKLISEFGKVITTKVIL